MSKIINLYSRPGGGKSSIASGLTYELKKRHLTVNNPYEFAKELSWENNLTAINDQLFVLANQHHGIVKSYNKVDYIVTDSPILLSLIYKNKYTDNKYPSYLYDEYFDKLILNIHRSYDSINIFLDSDRTSHNNLERFHDIIESKKIDKEILNMLKVNDVDFKTIKLNDDTVKNIMINLDIW